MSNYTNDELRDHLSVLRASLDNLRQKADVADPHRSYQDRMHICTRLIVAGIAVDEAIERLGAACDREAESEDARKMSQFLKDQAAEHAKRQSQEDAAADLDVEAEDTKNLEWGHP